MVNPKSLKNLKKMKKGETLNPGGMTKEFREDANNFKSALFNVFKNNQIVFEKEALKRPMETMKLLVSLCPREDESAIKDLLTGITVNVTKNYGNNG